MERDCLFGRILTHEELRGIGMSRFQQDLVSLRREVVGLEEFFDSSPVKGLNRGAMTSSSVNSPQADENLMASNACSIWLTIWQGGASNCEKNFLPLYRSLPRSSIWI